MWRAASGNRTFTGKLGELLANGIVVLVDEILEFSQYGDDVELEIPTFDALTPEQKIFVLRTVARGLFLENEPEPELTATSEGTIAAIFQRVEIMLEEEICAANDETAEPSRTFWRQTIKDALDEERAFEEAKLAAENGGVAPETDPDDEDEPLEPNLTDFSEWRFALERLEEQILWDLDYMNEKALDMAPEERAEFGSMFGVDDDYYSSVCDDPKREDARRMSEEIYALCKRVFGI